MRVISHFIVEQLKENSEVIKISAKQFGTTSLLNYFADFLPFADTVYECGNVVLSQNIFQKYSLQKHSQPLANYLIEEFSISPQKALSVADRLIGKMVHHKGSLDKELLAKSFEEFDAEKLFSVTNQWIKETRLASIDWKNMAFVVVTNGVAYAIPGGVATKLGFCAVNRFLNHLVTDNNSALTNIPAIEAQAYHPHNT